MEDNNTSLWNELWNSIVFCKDSILGKYSLDTYLDIIGEYTDKQIVEAEKQGLIYLGGECQIINSSDKNSYDFKIQMYFRDSQGGKILQEAKRSILKDRFVSNTDSEIGQMVRFEIKEPVEG